MASEASSRGFWRDDEIVVDKDGIPHYTGAQPGLMREYRKRVLFAFQSLEGSGDDDEKEKRSLKKKQSRFAKKLIDGLHGEAWRACQELVADPEALKATDGYKKVFACLQQIEKVSVIKATEAFDTYFEKCFRKRGQTIDSYLRQRRQDWADLQDVAENVTMSPELQAYFLLKNVGLPKEDRRQILLACQSNYSVEAIEKSLRVSYYDYHEREKAPPREWHGNRRFQRGPSGKGARRPHYANAVQEGDGDYDPDVEADDAEPDYTDDAFAVGDEEEPEQEDPSDAGASEDDEIYEAFSSYQESRKKLKEVQKARGFLKPRAEHSSPEERRQAIAKEKARTRCSACGRLGHWAGDGVCGKGSPSPRKKGGKGGGRHHGKGKAFLTSEAPLYFSLNDGDGDGYCDMILAESDGEMEQDDGETELDGKRRRPNRKGAASSSAAASEWEFLEAAPPFKFEGASREEPEHPDHGQSPDEEQQVILPVKTKDIETIKVTSFAEARPVGLEEMILRDLQGDCDRWGVQVSGNKAEILQRLRRLYKGELVPKRGCSKKMVQLQEHKGSLVPAELRSYSGAAVTRRHNYDNSSPKPAKDHSHDNISPKPAKDHSLGYSSASPSKDPGRIFRSYPGDFRCSTKETGHREKEKIVCPRSGLEIPEEMAVGQRVSQIGCVVCKCPLVLQQRRDRTGYFFGCLNFSSAKNCRFTLDLPEGLELYRKALGRGRRG